MKRVRAQNVFVRNFMLGSSALAVTGVVVPEVIQKPKAAIVDLSYQGTTVNYTIEVADPNNKLVPDTLKLALTSYDGTSYYPLELGENHNRIPDLEYGIKYTLKVLGNYGFGLGSLTEKSFRINTKLHAGFQNVRLDRTALSGELYVSDMEGKISDNQIEISLRGQNGERSLEVYSLFNGPSEDDLRYEVVDFTLPLEECAQDFYLEARYNLEQFPVTIATYNWRLRDYLPQVEMYIECFEEGQVFIEIGIFDQLHRFEDPTIRVEILQLENYNHQIYQSDFRPAMTQVEHQEPGIYFLQLDLENITFALQTYRLNVRVKSGNSYPVIAQKDFVPIPFSYDPYAVFNLAVIDHNSLQGEITIYDYGKMFAPYTEFSLHLLPQTLGIEIMEINLFAPREENDTYHLFVEIHDLPKANYLLIVYAYLAQDMIYACGDTRFEILQEPFTLSATFAINSDYEHFGGVIIVYDEQDHLPEEVAFQIEVSVLSTGEVLFNEPQVTMRNFDDHSYILEFSALNFATNEYLIAVSYWENNTYHLIDTTIFYHESTRNIFANVDITSNFEDVSGFVSVFDYQGYLGAEATFRVILTDINTQTIIDENTYSVMRDDENANYIFEIVYTGLATGDYQLEISYLEDNQYHLIDFATFSHESVPYQPSASFNYFPNEGTPYLEIEITDPTLTPLPLFLVSIRNNLDEEVYSDEYVYEYDGISDPALYQITVELVGLTSGTYTVYLSYQSDLNNDIIAIAEYPFELTTPY
ncbi:MAG: hypothetical protein ACOX3K_05455 [Bacilli bacterium]